MCFPFIFCVLICAIIYWYRWQWLTFSCQEVLMSTSLNVMLMLRKLPLFVGYNVDMHCTAVAPYMHQHDILIARLSELNQRFACQVVKAKMVLLLFPGR